MQIGKAAEHVSSTQDPGRLWRQVREDQNLQLSTGASALP